MPLGVVSRDNTDNCTWYQIPEHVQWDKVTDFHITKYLNTLQALSLKLHSNVFSCLSCQDRSHIDRLAEIYDDILECISVVSSSFSTKSSINKINRVVGWKKYCKGLYTRAREDFLIWHLKARIKLGENFIKIKKSRSDFKKSVIFLPYERTSDT